MGIGPDDITPGTLICVAEHSDYPFMLNRGANGRFEMLEIAYVHGIMFGETLTGRRF